jgi:hypothetical protein
MTVFPLLGSSLAITINNHQPRISPLKTTNPYSFALPSLCLTFAFLLCDFYISISLQAHLDITIRAFLYRLDIQMPLKRYSNDRVAI